jgi:hypothetical protein
VAGKTISKDDPFGTNGEEFQDGVGVARELTDEELKELEKAQLERCRFKDRPFPAEMDDEAFYGLAGDIVRIIEPHSEASREAILAQLLVEIGNEVGRGPQLQTGQYPSPKRVRGPRGGNILWPKRNGVGGGAKPATRKQEARTRRTSIR